MKKLLMLMLAAGLLAACSDKENTYEDEQKQAEEDLEKAKEDTKRLEGLTDQIGVENDNIDEDKAKELLEYEALGEGDTLTDIVVQDDEIKVSIEIADDVLDDKSISAETIYSRAGDALLDQEGWEVLTIDFFDVGTISMQRSEKETNEYGMDYFPVEKIVTSWD
ncbi:hypothetical protein [Sporosarcina newyorkensis]|uniref:hypothetical protein n=1 Tax=Sporosarcina newyorkensis TaxID=759851 RepID=UPI003D077D03